MASPWNIGLLLNKSIRPESGSKCFQNINLPSIMRTRSIFLAYSWRYIGWVAECVEPKQGISRVIMLIQNICMRPWTATTRLLCEVGFPVVDIEPFCSQNVIVESACKTRERRRLSRSIPAWRTTGQNGVVSCDGSVPYTFRRGGSIQDQMDKAATLAYGVPRKVSVRMRVGLDCE